MNNIELMVASITAFAFAALMALLTILASLHLRRVSSIERISARAHTTLDV